LAEDTSQSSAGVCTWIGNFAFGDNGLPSATRFRVLQLQGLPRSPHCIGRQPGQVTGLFAAYIFDDMGQPLPVVKKGLEVFAGDTPLRVPLWFESTNSLLGGVGRAR
jgi:hypothetical protein